MNSSDLEIVVKVRDEASKKLDAIGDTMQKSFKIGVAAAAAAATAVVAFGVSAVKAFADSQVQMARFSATMNSVTGVTEEHKNKILEAAAATRKLGFSDETASNVLAMFYQRTKSVTEATKLNALAMDLARAKGIDLAQAGEMITLVLSGNARALKQYGIELDETKTPLEALGELQVKVGGQAQAFAGTLTGKMTRLGETFGDLKEKIGEALSNLGGGGVLDFAIRLLERLEKIDFAGLFAKWRDSISSFISTFSEANGLVSGAQELWSMFVEFFNNYLKPSWDGLIATIKENKEFLIELLGAFAKFIAVIGAGVVLAALTALVVIFESLGAAIKWVKWFTDSLGEAFRDLATWIDKAFTSMSKFADKFGLSTLSANLKGIGSAVSGFFGGARAMGGPVTGGTPYMVGERGPELFVPGQNGTIVPNGVGGGMAITVNINGGMYLSEDAAEMMGDLIIDRLKMSSVI